MTVINEISILIILFVITFQDFERRLISWWLIPLLFISGAVFAVTVRSWSDWYSATLFNIGFLVIQFAFVSLWFIIRERKWINIVDSKIGLGDILFLLCACALFDRMGFVVFYAAGLIITLVSTIIVMPFLKKRTDIPLAGALSLVLIGLLITRMISPGLDLFAAMNEHSLLNVFTR